MGIEVRRDIGKSTCANSSDAGGRCDGGCAAAGANSFRIRTGFSARVLFKDDRVEG